MPAPSTCTFVPPYLLARIAASEDVAATSPCHRTLAIDAAFRTLRSATLPDRAPTFAPVPAPPATWTVHDAGHTAALPGTPVRTQDQPPTGDVAVDEAWAGVAGSLALFAEVYGHRSYDGRGTEVPAVVHYERDYANAFWDGRHLVFGDGDGTVFGRFTGPVDVLGHEFVHGVTEHTAGLVYADQPGALNESVSDAFAACLKQRLLGQSADEGDWLIGEGLFLPGVRGRALRSMSAPGTAYDDPRLGRDPQPGHLDDFVVTTDDNGGVHINSGIPNRAFHLAAVAISGSAADGAGRVWWRALTGGDVGPRTDFAGFAAATVGAAGAHEAAVRQAWEAVGVTPGSARASAGPVVTGDDRVVEVRRSGGFVGVTTVGRLDAAAPGQEAEEVRRLLARPDLLAVEPGRPRPDAYLYEFRLGATSVRVAEPELTPDLRRLAEVVLAAGE